jgi:uncharacterized membrane protein
VVRSEGLGNKRVCNMVGEKTIRNYIQYFLHLVLFSLWAFSLTICLVCIVVILCVFVVSYVYLLCLICICCALCVFVVLCVYCRSYFRCRTAG